MTNKPTNQTRSSTVTCDGTFECGILEIDWRNRDFTMRGIGGHSDDLMTPTEVVRALRRRCSPDKLRVAAVVWKENSDGCQ